VARRSIVPASPLPHALTTPGCRGSGRLCQLDRGPARVGGEGRAARPLSQDPRPPLKLDHWRCPAGPCRRGGPCRRRWCTHGGSQGSPLTGRTDPPVLGDRGVRTRVEDLCVDDCRAPRHSPTAGRLASPRGARVGQHFLAGPGNGPFPGPGRQPLFRFARGEAPALFGRIEIPPPRPLGVVLNSWASSGQSEVGSSAPNSSRMYLTAAFGIFYALRWCYGSSGRRLGPPPGIPFRCLRYRLVLTSPEPNALSTRSARNFSPFPCRRPDALFSHPRSASLRRLQTEWRSSKEASAPRMRTAKLTGTASRPTNGPVGHALPSPRSRQTPYSRISGDPPSPRGPQWVVAAAPTPPSHPRASSAPSRLIEAAWSRSPPKSWSAFSR